MRSASMTDIKAAAWAAMVIPKTGVWMFHVELKEAWVFLNMAEILVVPEVTHDVCGVVQYLMYAFRGLSS